MKRYISALVDALLAETKNRRRIGTRVTLYTVTGTTLRGVLVSRDASDYELRQVEIAINGAERFRPMTRPVIVPANKVDYYTLDS